MIQNSEIRKKCPHGRRSYQCTVCYVKNKENGVQTNSIRQKNEGQLLPQNESAEKLNTNKHADEKVVKKRTLDEME